MQDSITSPLVFIPRQIPGISCMLLMVYAYGFAPLQPTLMHEFGSPLTSLTVPLFALCFGLAATGTVFLWPFIKLQQCFMISLCCLCAGALLLGLSPSVEIFLLTRALTGLGTGMMLPSALMLANAGKKSRSFANLIMIMFALGTGITFGPSLGGWFNSFWGWRFLYMIIGILAGVLALCLYANTGETKVWRQSNRHHRTVRSIFCIILKGRNTYLFVYLTAVFHSGVFVWISSYFITHYQQDEYHIANDLMIFGLPGLVVTYLLFRFHLDYKVVRILYAGLGLTIAGLLMLMTNLPLWLAECLLAVISIGFSCSQPIFIGILRMPSTVTPMAIGSAVLFFGYGSGPLIMTELLKVHSGIAIAFLALLMAILAMIAASVWRQPALHTRKRHPNHAVLLKN